MSSYDVIRAFKRANRPEYKVGHGGTLDPFADGVLLILLGKATKLMNSLTELTKTYVAVAVLGAKTETLDVTGQVSLVEPSHLPTLEEVEAVGMSMIGSYDQEIPEFSAAKVGGKPRYLLARRGEIQTRKTKPVKIYQISEISLKTQAGERTVRFTAAVGSGTYIRQLSYDLFQKLHVESYLKSLTRTRIGDFSLEKCVKLSEFETGEWRDKVVRHE